MANDVEKQKPKEIIEQRMQVELISPIAHDFILYSRGLHELDESLARLFLTFKDPVDPVPQVRDASLSPAFCARGTTKPWGR